MARGPLRADDTGISPVIGVILLVGIAVLLASGVYVLATGFLGGTEQDQVPAASFQVTTCDDASEVLTTKLVNGGPLDRDDLSAALYDIDTGEPLETDVDVGTGTWNPSESVDLTFGSADLEEGIRYELDFIYHPASKVHSAWFFRC